jgi:3-oxoacyl-[acyl-carrier protein] reductase
MFLDTKVAIVTGAATGIGEGIARLFAEEGAHLFLLDRDSTRNAAVAASIPAIRPVAAFAGDVRDPKAIQAVVAVAIEQFGGVDVLVNNAGIYPRQSFIDMSEAQWDEMQDINLRSMFHSTKTVLPAMIARRYGKIINISSVTFHLGSKDLVHYVASKGGVIGLTRSLAREVGEHGVFVNCITPGAVQVEAEKQVATEEQLQEIIDLQSLKRRIVPLDIARACLFLASELSDGMTGQTLNVDGGWVMC